MADNVPPVPNRSCHIWSNFSTEACQHTVPGHSAENQTFVPTHLGSPCGPLRPSASVDLFQPGKSFRRCRPSSPAGSAKSRRWQTKHGMVCACLCWVSRKIIKLISPKMSPKINIQMLSKNARRNFKELPCHWEHITWTSTRALCQCHDPCSFKPIEPMVSPILSGKTIYIISPYGSKHVQTQPWWSPK